jgi:hypothetical protein
MELKELNRFLGVTAYNLLRRSYYLSDILEAYKFREQPLYDFYEKLYGDKFCNYVFENSKRVFENFKFLEVKTKQKLFSDTLKEKAFRFFVTECFPSDGNQKWRNIKAIDTKKIDSLWPLAAYHFFLAICYRNFFQFKDVLEKDSGCGEGEVFYHLDALRLELARVTGETFKPVLQRKNNSRKGGKQPKQLPGILSAVKKIIQDNGQKSYSAERLWLYFEKHHKGKTKAFKINGFKIYFDYKNLVSLEGRIFQVSSNGKAKSIGRSAFAGYVKEAKQS